MPPQSCPGSRWLSEAEALACPASWDSALSPTLAPPRFREGSKSAALWWESIPDLPKAGIRRGHVFGTDIGGGSCTFGSPWLSPIFLMCFGPPQAPRRIRCQRSISHYYSSDVANPPHPRLTAHANQIAKERYSSVLWEVQLLG